jgi:protein phosphatase
MQDKAVEWRSAGKSHVGLVRALNEDAFLDRSELGIWAVADGMGGHEAGDIASISAVTALAMVHKAASLSDMISDSRARLRAVNDSLYAASERNSITAGSTVVALLSQGTHAAVLWAGDSRAYLQRDGNLRQLTLDHSRVQQMVSAGLIQPEEAEDHPEANIITRAIGVLPEVEFDTQIIKAEPGDTFLLCSDGLYREVESEDISASLALDSCDEASDRLIEQALEGGGEDNISVVVIRLISGDAATERPPTDPGASTDADLTVIDKTRVPHKQ